MTHRSENGHKLIVRVHQVRQQTELETLAMSAAVTVVLPPAGQYQNSLCKVGEYLTKLAQRLPQNGTLIVLGDTTDLVAVESAAGAILNYQLWIAIKTKTPKEFASALPRNHFGALVLTKYKGTLKHTKTRVAYTYCPACQLTTKDYGGKKHTYDPYGTLLSDVWRDIAADLEGDLTEIYDRLADLFGVDGYQVLDVLDCRDAKWTRELLHVSEVVDRESNNLPAGLQNTLLQGDCLEKLRLIPDNSVDFAFADPPYNLAKKYLGYADDLEIRNYFEWCDRWLHELYRVLKPGCTLAVLNIPLWAIRHFVFLQKHMLFQNWIAWDALSFPVRQIMPAHYAILCFSKGEARSLSPELSHQPVLRQLIDNYCIREKCVIQRQIKGVVDTQPLTDIWADAHRIKHNSRRVDHPCQLPPKLLYRLISLFTRQGDVVLDPFDGAGTTSLAAHQLDRVYIGIELNPVYHDLATARHQEVDQGLDPFRKEERELTAKNSPVQRIRKQKYAVPKKTLQLEVKRVAELLGHIPSRDEMIRLGQYPVEYYDNYFLSWGEVTASARNKGMSERQESDLPAESLTREADLQFSQMSLLEEVQQ